MSDMNISRALVQFCICYHENVERLDKIKSEELSRLKETIKKGSEDLSSSISNQRWYSLASAIFQVGIPAFFGGAARLKGGEVGLALQSATTFSSSFVPSLKEFGTASSQAWQEFQRNAIKLYESDRDMAAHAKQRLHQTEEEVRRTVQETIRDAQRVHS